MTSNNTPSLGTSQPALPGLSKWAVWGLYIFLVICFCGVVWAVFIKPHLAPRQQVAPAQQQASTAPAVVVVGTPPAPIVAPATQDPETSLDPSPPPSEVVAITAPAVSDTANEMADVNWANIRLHVNYSLASPEGFPNPAVRFRCWNQFTNAWTISTDPATCIGNTSAVGVQSTSDQPVTLHFGFTPK